MDVVAELVRARETYERGDWAAAFDTWSDLALGELPAQDCTGLATSAHLLGRQELCISAHQRAFELHLDAGDTVAAALSATQLAMVFATDGELSLGAGWCARAERLLDELDADVVERGYVALHHMFAELGAGDISRALERAQSVLDYGRRFDDRDLLAMGLSSTGRLSLYADQVRRGLALFDEAMVAVTTGEVSPVIAGHVYCVMIEGCQEVGDLGRASAWTTALARWCEAQPGLVAFTGQCAVHRGQIMRLHGAFAEAVEEFDAAIARYLATTNPTAAGLAYAERGDVLRILGDLDGADASYDRAAEQGFEPQPGLALLWLARGRTKPAVAAIRRLLAETQAPVFRTRLLAAAAEILCASGDLDAASAAAVELGTIADDFGCDALHAMAAAAHGRVTLETGDTPGALPYLRKAITLWSRLDCPYETARVRTLVGRALRALGDEESAIADFTAAQESFRTLGSAPGVAAVAELLTPGDLPAGLTSREAEVLRLVAAGKNNAQIAGDLVLSEKTVARHLSNIFGKLEVSSRTAAAAYAFEHDLA